MAARLLVSDLTDCGTDGYFQLSVHAAVVRNLIWAGFIMEIKKHLYSAYNVLGYGVAWRRTD